MLELLKEVLAFADHLSQEGYAETWVHRGKELEWLKVRKLIDKTTGETHD